MDTKRIIKQIIIRFSQFWRARSRTDPCKSRCSAWLRRWHRIRNFCLQNSANLHCIYDSVHLLSGLPSTEWCASSQGRTLLCSRCLLTFMGWCLEPWRRVCFICFPALLIKFQIIIISNFIQLYFIFIIWKVKWKSY